MAAFIDNQCISMGYGQAGVNMMNSYWKTICREFDMGLDGELNLEAETSYVEINRLFCEYSSGKFVPRCIFIDTEPVPCEQIMSSSTMKNLYGKHNFAYGKQDAKNIFACGFYGDTGMAIEKNIQEQYRQQVERCNHVSEVNNYFSVCGGTGSGVAARRSQIEDNKRTYHVDFALYPSNKFSNNCVEPYNALLNIYSSRSNVSRFIFDNAALYKNLSQCNKSPTFQHANQYVAEISKSFNIGSEKGSTAAGPYCTNLIPFPKLNTLIAGFCIGEKTNQSNTEYLIDKAFTNPSISYNPQHFDKNLGAALIFRGNFERCDISKSIRSYDNFNFANFSPYGYTKVFNPKLPKFLNDSVFTTHTKKDPDSTLSLFANNTIVGDVLTDIVSNVDLLLSNRSFMHWYLKEGMNELEILDARLEIDQIIDAYKMIKLSNGKDLEE